jgi:homoaconitate hydratase family protein/3-isopropylmalate dehydratase small subunit
MAISRFFDSGTGICHQLMLAYARPGMLIVGSDSHTTTAGAFNTFAAGIDRTESASIWKSGETWFMVPETARVTLSGRLQEGVSAKDLALWIIGMIGSDGANYMSVEYHGDGLKNLTIPDRMTMANMAAEMGAKNAVFPADDLLASFLGVKHEGTWADRGAKYLLEIELNLKDISPVVAAPHQVDNIRSVQEVSGTVVHEGLIGTCTNGRLEDLRAAAAILRGKKIKEGFRLNVIPASRAILLDALNEGLITDLVSAGANILTPSCGPCLGTGLGIPADGHAVISTANRNFPGRMGNRKASVYLASPATVAMSSLNGTITDPRAKPGKAKYPFKPSLNKTFEIKPGDNRKNGALWNYSDADNLNTDQMFAGKHTYNVLSTDKEAILPLLFADFDPSFAGRVEKGDIIIAGDNFGCGSSREHPSVGLAHAGIRAVIVKSVNRIFYRSSINQGLPLIVHREAVESYKPGDAVDIDFEKGKISVGTTTHFFTPLPAKLREILDKKGLVNFMKSC